MPKIYFFLGGGCGGGVNSRCRSKPTNEEKNESIPHTLGPHDLFRQLLKRYSVFAKSLIFLMDQNMKQKFAVHFMVAEDLREAYEPRHVITNNVAC